MSVPTKANHVFLPWVRQGGVTQLLATDTGDATLHGVVSLVASVHINGAVAASRQLVLCGPGNITGIDTRQVVRTVPANGSNGFEPNLFPAVEFDRPDFPWLFTPATADASQRLRPWICLVVVRRQDGVTLADRSGGSGVPVLTIAPPADAALELPDLTESWAWAHAQVTGTATEITSLGAALAGDPAYTLSRLLCPRRLQPHTEYLACVVPAFDLGRKAGLGEPIKSEDEQALQPAWVFADKPAVMRSVRLPVYHNWEFRTGSGRDFETLVGALKPAQPAEASGALMIDLGAPGFAIDPAPSPAARIAMEGALRKLDGQAAEWPVEMRSPFQSALARILNAPAQAAREGTQEPLVAPPIYGASHAGRDTVFAHVDTTANPSPALWLDDLNLDPRWRAAAALGTRVVQMHQETLAAAAWEQLGHDIKRVNQRLRMAQLALAVNTQYVRRHFNRFNDEALLQVLAPAAARLRVSIQPSSDAIRLSAQIRRSALPHRTLSAQVRRMASPRSAVVARFRVNIARPIAIVSSLDTPAAVVPPRKPDSGCVAMETVSGAGPASPGASLKEVILFERLASALESPPAIGDFQVAPEGAMRSVLDFAPNFSNSVDADAFIAAARAHHTQLIQKTLRLMPAAAASPLHANALQDGLLRCIDPNTTIRARLRASIKSNIGWTGDSLEPIIGDPAFEAPMFEALRELSQEFVFPGMHHVPQDTVTLLQTNAKFVEAFLIGLNTELGRELLWRNFPTHHRGTFFRHFWDPSVPDVPPISEWVGALGAHHQDGDRLVLVLRGELLRRYPATAVYAVPCDAQGKPSTDATKERHPGFRGTLPPDVTFLGFDLTRDEILGDPGWFFVIQQQPMEPVFGLDAAQFTGELVPPASWNDLSWRHFAASEAALEAMSHAPVEASLPALGPAVWGRNAAHQAFITLQRPLRVYRHARELVSH